MSNRFSGMLILLLTLIMIVGTTVQAQDEPPRPVPATSNDLMKVNILFVGAHPDDDSVATATLARYGLDRGARTGVITATRGEGGGNSTGRELGTSLGMVRESEERMAMAALGVDHVFYLNELDWAFTTSASATEQFWGYDEPLANMVRLFRVLRPDVVITMNPSPGSGHGHHQYAARLATEAFFLAGDSTAFPEQLETEFIDVWQPKKLYYGLGYGGAGLTGSVVIPTNEYSPSQYATYADVEASALRLYRSQGFDAFATVPAPAWLLGPEVFMLVASVVPTQAQETDLMTGIWSGVDQAPANLEMGVTLDNFYVAQGGQITADVELRNLSNEDLSGVTITLLAPEGFTVSDPSAAVDVAAGESTSASFTVDVPDDADVSQFQSLTALFESSNASGAYRSAGKTAMFQVTTPISVELQPIEAVTIYREWATNLGLETLLGLAPTQIALGADSSGMIPVILTNRSDEEQEVTVTLTVDNDALTLAESEQTVTVGAGETVTLDFAADVPADLMGTSFPVMARATYGDYDLTNEGTIQVVPSLDVPMLTEAPTIDGDLSEYADLTAYDIPFGNLWEGETTDEADLTGSFRVAYDDQFLYVALEVQDDTVVSNIAPNDIKGHWRSDSVEITVDPQGAGVSEHTLTTFKVGIFPFDIEGNVQAARDADANQGVIADTAPDMDVASAAIDGGYALEVAIPWSALPSEIEDGNFGFDILLYDCDKADAAVGENCNEARTAWSAWDQIQGNPRLWGHASLGE